MLYNVIVFYSVTEEALVSNLKLALLVDILLPYDFYLVFSAGI